MYIRPRKNKRITRHRLKQRKQTSEESFDNFVKDLRLMLLDCDYTDSDDMLIDCIISGAHEKKLQEKLLDRGEGLTLAKALDVGRQFELSRQQIKIVRDEDTPVFALGSHKSRKFRKPKGASQQSQPDRSSKQDKRKSNRGNAPKSSQNTGKCGSCGKDSNHTWNNGKCPAIGTTCSYCKKPNHWLAVCRRRLRLNTLDILSEDEGTELSESEILTIHSTVVVNTVSDEDDKWLETITLSGGQDIVVKIDTGAKCNAITLEEYRNISHSGELRRSNNILKSFTNDLIKPVAVADLTFQV
ncbi:uncharacterized protein [Haliotis asinina]|uniref:uncharacterized protein n=1 Tax=Haliotis asinina TaxID=109174 RepID=UPI0035318C16